ncbi:MAG: hypothetical protein QM775_31770 [Pirellulales bacterium]
MSAPDGSSSYAVEVGPDGEYVVEHGPTGPQTMAPGGKPLKRIDRLRQLNFDRRAKAVLETWSADMRPKPKVEPTAKPAALSPAKPAEKAPPTKADDSAKNTAKPADKPQDAPPKSVGPTTKKPQDTPTTGDVKSGTTTAPAAVDKPAGGAPQQVSSAAKPATGPDPLDAELKAFQTSVTLGRWGEVKSYLAALTKEEREVAWRRLLESLASPQNLAGPQSAQFSLRRYADAARVGVLDRR